MINLHTGNSQPLTKLMILQQAITVIGSLEHEVRGIWPEPLGLQGEKNMEKLMTPKWFACRFCMFTGDCI